MITQKHSKIFERIKEERGITVVDGKRESEIYEKLLALSGHSPGLTNSATAGALPVAMA